MASGEKSNNLSAAMDRVEKTINFLCVVFLTVQVISIIVIVFGRYVFRFVPQGTEELALTCMVWFSLLSISLSIRDDSHIKMEIMDALVSKEKLVYFQYFAAFMSLGFSGLMIKYGINLVELTAGTQMGGLRISEGWLYLAIPASGLCMGLASLVFLIERFRRRRNDD